SPRTTWASRSRCRARRRWCRRRPGSASPSTNRHSAGSRSTCKRRRVRGPSENDTEQGGEMEKRTRRAFLAVAAAAAAAAAMPAHGADDAGAWPTRAVRIVVPFPPGGSTDITARLVAARLAQRWQHPVTVENKPGAAANIGTEMVARAPADGYAMLLGTTALPISAATFAKLPYDP